MNKDCRWCGKGFVAEGKGTHRLYCCNKCKYAMKNSLYRQPDRREKRERKRTKAENEQSAILRSIREAREKDIIRDIKYLLKKIEEHLEGEAHERC